MCRQEATHRCYILLTAWLPDVAGEMAVTLSTYDQWLESACLHTNECLNARKYQRLIRNDWDSPLISGEEKLLIRDTALRLRCCRKDGYLNARLSIISCIVSLAVVTWRILCWKDRDNQDEASGIFLIVAMFSHLTLAVCINGNVGTFQYQDEAARAVFELYTSLKLLQSCQDDTFPLFPLPFSGTIDSGLDRVCANATAFSRLHAKLGSASGTLNCLRPVKSYPAIGEEDCKDGVLLFISTCAITISFSGAIAITFCVPTSNREAEIFSSIGCFLIWLLNWIVSMGGSRLFSRKVIHVGTYGRILVGSDITSALIILSCIV